MVNKLFLLSVVLLSACSNWKELSVSNIEALRMGKMDKDGMEAEIDVKINNPNNTSFTVYSSTLEIKMNNVSVGHPHLKRKVKIKAHSNETYTFAVSGKMENLLGGGGIFGLLS